jgi:hypothetical protein
VETAAEVVLRVAPGDDAGARTADLYDWQAAMAAADGLRMYADALDDAGLLPDDADGRILCEHHEDWVALRGPDAELVSAKYREPASGAWTTIHQLVGDGGLGHLFGRWAALDRKPSVRLVTCAALANGAPRNLAAATTHLRRQTNGATLDGAVRAQVDASVAAFARELLAQPKGLPAPWQPPADPKPPAPGDSHLSDAREFLAALVIQDDRPARAFAEHAAPSMYVQPILARLSRPDVPARAVWEAVWQLFRTRMRARGPILEGSLPTVLALPITSTTADSGGPSPAEQALASRIVAVQDIGVAVRAALANPLGYLPLSPPLRLTRLSTKMARGGCADTSIERAEHLLLDFRAYWRTHAAAAPGRAAERPVLDRALMRAADEATAASRTASVHGARRCGPPLARTSATARRWRRSTG